MDMKSNRLYSMGSLALLAVLFTGLVILSDVLFKGWRIDLTENGQYTLNQGTQNILGKLEEPVTIYYFFSQDASRELPQVRSYAQWVGELLTEMADRSNGKLTIKRIDPKPFSPEEDQAEQFGLQSVPVGAGSDPLYFGLAGTNSLDTVQAIPFLQPSKQDLLEYDVIKLISTLSHPNHKKVGLLTSLDMQPGFDQQTQRSRPAWAIYDQLNQLFDLQVIPRGATKLPDGIDLLLLVHPKNLSDQMRYSIDQFVLNGGRVVAFLDPFAESDVGGNPSDPMARLSAGSSSTLGPLLTAWGVKFDPTHIVGDMQYAMQVNMGNGGPPARHIGILSIRGKGLNDKQIVSSGLESVNLSSTGWFDAVDGATTKLIPLVRSSDHAGPIDASRMRFLGNPEDLMSGFQPTGDRYTLAARVTGPASSAFKKAPEGVKPDTFKADSGGEDINVILFADTDMLTDRLWVQRQQFLNQVLMNAFADNGTLVANAVDNLLGSKDLISIRTRASASRPFERVDQLRVEAEGKYRSTEESLQQELKDTEQKLTQMQSNRNDNDLTVMSDEQQAEIDKFVQKRIQIRKDLRKVRHDLDRNIDSLGTRLKVINIGLMPALIILFAIFFGQARRRRRRESKS